MALGGMRQVLKSAFSLLRLLRESRFNARGITCHRGNSETCYVFGNGPSLGTDIRHKFDYFTRQNVVCVNQFALSDWFTELKPKYYVLVDPMYWIQTAPSDTLEVRDRLFAAFHDKVRWDLTLMIPHEAYEIFNRALCENPHIKIVRFNRTPFWGVKSLVFKLYDLGLGMPQAQNVMVAAIYLAILLGFRKIAVLGADHSWHESLELGADNKVYLRYGYFNDQSPKLAPFTVDGSADNIFTMEKIFLAIGRMFGSYIELAEYAKQKDISIVNLSSVSYIDAFPKVDIDEFIRAMADPDSNNLSDR